ncbi:hypothetical protein EDEG_03496 [Edhazardia aedis USNM 41457]|uniref:Uncharacterized protein n=1 Tax=Edhazardia aedis (strain USNM 41457) TaxID=1003232 RepID=J9D2M0_EDHAE|nr:hypothetical protein EDEG_03496 [Edhazardia aedis USNM 41457]|eukprot:EJW02046.1 hypothetical protein EDEG_03496 [Edhazardia aedis USNM 41457]
MMFVMLSLFLSQYLRAANILPEFDTVIPVKTSFMVHAQESSDNKADDIDKKSLVKKVTSEPAKEDVYSDLKYSEKSIDVENMIFSPQISGKPPHNDNLAIYCNILCKNFFENSFYPIRKTIEIVTAEKYTENVISGMLTAINLDVNIKLELYDIIVDTKESLKILFDDQSKIEKFLSLISYLEKKIPDALEKPLTKEVIYWFEEALSEKNKSFETVFSNTEIEKSSKNINDNAVEHADKKSFFDFSRHNIKSKFSILDEKQKEKYKQQSEKVLYSLKEACNVFFIEWAVEIISDSEYSIIFSSSFNALRNSFRIRKKDFYK